MSSYSVVSLDAVSPKKRIASGVLPWFSLDSESVESYYGESQEKINRCLNCPKACCNNCFGNSPVRENREDRFMEMMRTKYTKEQICRELKISRATYFRYKKAYAI